MKKIWKFISSMKFAILLLAVLALACSAASLITQGQSYEWYARQYSERTAALIVALHLDDAFHSPWFVLINAFLCVNLLACNLLRLPQLVARTKAEADPARAIETEGAAQAGPVRDPGRVFDRLRMPNPVSTMTADGREALFKSVRRAGLWGAWVCHLGILLLILGFGLGQMTQKQYTVYGVPGQTRPIGDTGYLLTIDDFEVGLRPDDTVEQYTAEITVRDVDGRGSQSATVSVNNPASLYGMKFYQNSTGWAAKINVKKDGAPLQDEVVCAGEYLVVKDKPDLVVFFSAFYPDYVMTPGVGPSTATGALNNPAYLYQVYYQEKLLGMNVLMPEEALTIDEYTVTFTDPQSYTLIQIKVDHFTWLALIGGLLTMLGLILAFYVQPAKVWAVKNDAGWTIHGTCRKGGALFRDRLIEAAREEDADASS